MIGNPCRPTDTALLFQVDDPALAENIGMHVRVIEQAPNIYAAIYSPSMELTWIVQPLTKEPILSGGTDGIGFRTGHVYVTADRHLKPIRPAPQPEAIPAPPQEVTA